MEFTAMTTPEKRHTEDAAVALHYEIASVIGDTFSMEEALASFLADAITRGLRARLGGQDIYVPAPDKRERDEAIRREFNGRNLADVMRRHGISKSRLYQIVGDGANKTEPCHHG
jgi:Mor family transcriptional regulator